LQTLTDETDYTVRAMTLTAPSTIHRSTPTVIVLGAQ
jgi:hypothetical protein